MQNSGAHSQQWISWRGTGIRARLRQRGRFGAFFLQVVPWLNAVVIAALVAAVSRQVVVSGGIGFDLPAAPFSEGVRSGPGLVLFRTDGPDSKIIAFFDDVRYVIGADDEKRLADEVARYARRFGGGQILLLADADLRHGDVMHVVDLVRGAGIKRVNVAVKPK